MKVTDIKTFAVDCFRTNWVFVKVYTDEGVTGVGEATLEYKEKALIGAVEHIREYLIGQNPLDVEKHTHAIYRDAYWRCSADERTVRGGVCAVGYSRQNAWRAGVPAAWRAGE